MGLRKSLSEYIFESISDFKIVYNMNTKDVVDIADKCGFELFKNNFDKNNNSFPYMNPNDIKYVIIKYHSDICGILAYGIPPGLDSYRKNREDPSHNMFAHIFDLEVSEKYRGRKLSELLISKCIDLCKKENLSGVTLMAIDNSVAQMYERKFGFKIYNRKYRWMELKF